MSGDGVELLRNAKKRLRKGLELLRKAIPKVAGGDGIAAQGKKEAQEMVGRAAFGGLIGVVGVVEVVGLIGVVGRFSSSRLFALISKILCREIRETRLRAGFP